MDDKDINVQNLDKVTTLASDDYIVAMTDFIGTTVLETKADFIADIISTDSNNNLSIGTDFNLFSNNSIINIKNFGAIGDGITNDTAAFSAAKAIGANIFLPKGSYLIDSSALTISIPGQKIIGEGEKFSVIIPNGTEGVILDGSASPAYRSHIGIKGIGIQSSTIISGSVGLKLYKIAESDIADVYIKGFDIGLYLQGALINQFNNVTLEANNTAIFFETTTSPTLNANLNAFYNSKIINNYRQAVNYNSAGAGLSFINSEFESNGTSTSVSLEALSGQKVVTLTSVDNLITGDTLILGAGTASYELGVIDTIDTVAKTVTLIDNLTNTQAVAVVATLGLNQLYFNGVSGTGVQPSVSFYNCWFESNKGLTDIYFNAASANGGMVIMGSSFYSTLTYHNINHVQGNITVIGCGLNTSRTSPQRNVLLGAVTLGLMISNRLSSYLKDVSSTVRVETTTGILDTNLYLSSAKALRFYLDTTHYHEIINGTSNRLFVTPYNNNDTEFSGGVRVQSTSAQILSGIDTPEGVVTAAVGSLFMRTNGGANTTLYVKESGTGNTGWIAK